MMIRSTYIGDSVYVEFDGYNLELYTRNDGDPQTKDNLIILEPEVVANLLLFLNSKEPENVE